MSPLWRRLSHFSRHRKYPPLDLASSNSRLHQGIVCAKYGNLFDGLAAQSAGGNGKAALTQLFQQRKFLG
jgi:hypothetical protein